MAADITDRQREYLLAIRKFTDANQYPPTLRELGELLKTSGEKGAPPLTTTAVTQVVWRLKRKGVLDLEPMKARSIRLTKAGLEALR